MTLDSLRALRETATLVNSYGEEVVDQSEPEGRRLIALAPCLVDALIEAQEALSRIDQTLTTVEGDNIPVGETPKMHARQLARAAVARIDTLEKGNA